MCALTQLLDELLVLVELLQVLHAHGVDAHGLGLLAVPVVAQHADLHLWPRRVRQLDGAAEPLVLLRVIVLQANLQLHGLLESALLDR